ncbi:BrnA antitoxin family protein [Leptothrix discophora]|uniref:BrnA antitoxin family protein n=1 Tax=Leptothrix discophora TaxID=89 RepID=A0ABT9FY71_LEPDI|nr:BrnA antitoxin family protein [Leptothrix discophora]MDP4299189.1 BrnA antitoxin family protein [Leptothrix discophora]
MTKKKDGAEYIVTRSGQRVRVPTPEEDAEITAAALADPDTVLLTDEQIDAMVPYSALRGRPPLARPKVLVSVRYSPEVIDFFKSTGEGWQTRMDEVLKAHVARVQADGEDTSG